MQNTFKNLRYAKLRNARPLFSYIYGWISPSISPRTSLGHLNLSHNNLSCPIPGGHLSTFDEFNYVGNSGNYGSPLPTKCVLLVVQEGKIDFMKITNQKIESWDSLLALHLGSSSDFGVFVVLWLQKHIRTVLILELSIRLYIELRGNMYQLNLQSGNKMDNQQLMTSGKM